MIGKSKSIIYIIPPDEVIDEYARTVCTELGKLQNTSAFADSEVVWGLAGFLKLAAAILSRASGKNADE